MDENAITVPDLTELGPDEWERAVALMRFDINRWNAAQSASND
jgi:hypothetical protein